MERRPANSVAAAAPARLVTGDGGAAVRSAVAGAARRADQERSIRFTPDGVHCDRFLLTIARNDLGRRPRAAFLELCRTLQVPLQAVDAADAHFADATFVHVGHEGAASGSIRKLYLEFPERFERGRAEEGRDGRFLLYLAFKWQPACEESAGIARYFVVPAAGEGALRAAMACHRTSPGMADPVHWAELIVARRPSGAPPPMFLEVEEEGNPRRSFDINLYDWGLGVGDVAGHLTEAAWALGIERAEALAHLNPVRDEPLGHISAGRGRRGEPFLTVYFGARAP